LGKIKRKALLAIPLQVEKPAPICPLCERVIPRHHLEAHHLIPKSKGGKLTALLHSACHKQIHALITETELANHFNTTDSLKAHEGLAKFIAWIKTKPIDFKERVRKSKHIKSTGT
jgi:hypothetical protein